MTSAFLDFGAPVFDRVEFFVDKRRAAIVSLAALSGGSALIYTVASRTSLLATIAEMLAAVLALAGGAALIAIGVTLLLRLFLRRGAALVIDSQGIHDRRAGGPMLPWTHIRDIRPLDRHGRQIGIELLDPQGNAETQRRRWVPAVFRFHTRPVTVIDTFFLRSRSGNRVLDFVMPMTALAPIDMSETPVCDDTLSADAKLSQCHTAALCFFILFAALVPAAAATLLVY